ncbi:WD40 repeat domain-containing protein [Bacillus sp. FJAT-45037]|uniref:WD40 repeat domain-containing protein n=1 Tax=Bacillus sp. FJAT-45037 TaxID=2011007 RepID=UPI000C249B5D|nr:WD40 repeat domain-containing protein [Bacillus sp. FJAT-45037]
MSIISKQKEALKRHQGPVTSVLFNEDHKKFVTSGYDGKVGSFEFETGIFSILGRHDHLVNKVVSSPLVDLVASCSSDYTIKIWDLKEDKLVRTLLGHSDDVEDFVFVDEKMGISTSRDKRIIIWDLENGSIKNIILGHEKDVLSIAYFGGKVITTGDDKTLRMWDVKTGKLLNLWGPFDVETDTCAIDTLNNRAVLGCDDGVIRIISFTTGEIIEEIEAHSSGIKKVAISPVNGDILSAAYDQKILLWDSHLFKLKLSLEGVNTKWERSLTFSPSGTYIIAGSFDGTVHIWDSHSGKYMKELGGENNYGNACFNEVSVEGDSFASVSDDGIIRAGNITSGEFTGEFIPASGRYLMNAVELFEGRVYAGAHNQKLHIFELEKACCSSGSSNKEKCKEGQEILLNEGPINTIKGIKIDTHTHMIIGCYSGAIVVTDRDGLKLKTINIHSGAVKSLAVNKNKNIGVSCSAAGELFSWDLNGVIIEKYLGHTAIINDVDIDPTGQLIASVSRDFTLKVFNIWTGKLISSFDLGNKSLKSVSFLSPSEIIVGDYWGNVIKVDLNSETIIKSNTAKNGISSIAVCSGEDLALLSSYDGRIYQVDQNLKVTKQLVKMNIE